MKTAIALGLAALLVAAAGWQVIRGRGPGGRGASRVWRADRPVLFWAVVALQLGLAAAAVLLAARWAGVGPFAGRRAAGLTITVGGDPATVRWVSVRNDGPGDVVIRSVRVNGGPDCLVAYRPDGATVFVADGAGFPQAEQPGEAGVFVFHDVRPVAGSNVVRPVLAGDVARVDVVTDRGTLSWRPGDGAR